MLELGDLVQEFLSNPEFEGFMRVVLAGFLTAIIGLEREVEGKPAGIRTYALVGMGACAFTAVGLIGFGNGDPVSRVTQGIITGIGFIGAGTILQLRHRIVGLTTAAGIWVAAAIGVAIGAGLYIIGIGAAISAFVLLQFLNPGILVRFGLASPDDIEGRIEREGDKARREEQEESE